MSQIEQVRGLLSQIASLAKQMKPASGDSAYVDLQYDAPSLSSEEYSRRLRSLDATPKGEIKRKFREAMFDLILQYLDSDEVLRRVMRDFCSQDSDILIAYSSMAEEMRWLVVTPSDVDLFRKLMVGYSVLDLGDSRGHHLFLEVAGLVERGLAANLPVTTIAQEMAHISSDQIRDEDFATVSTQTFFLNCPLV